jgi:hypothetical protein
VVKYTHTVTLLRDGVEGVKFKVAIVGEHVHCGEFIRPDGTTYSEPETYEHDSGIENLTPELWYDNKERWSVKKIVQFKGNK